MITDKPTANNVGQYGDGLIENISERKIELESTKHLRKPNRKKASLFLAGPVPFEWIRSLPCPVCRLALVVRAFMYMRSTNQLTINSEICRHAGLMDRNQKQRAVSALAKTDLFEVERHRGRCPVAHTPTRCEE